MARSMNRVKTTPVPVERSNRTHTVTTMTSFQAGKVTPLAAIPLLREDQITSGQLQIQFAMEETEELLLNPVNGVVRVTFVPFSAFERFGRSMDVYNKAYAGKPPFEGEEVIPWLEKFAYGDIDDNEIHRALGLHGKASDMVSTMYVEAYNLAENQRLGNASPKLTKRERLDKTLAPAHWPASRLDHIVPDWDDASMEGEVALNVIEGRLAVKGIGLPAAGTAGGGSGAHKETGTPGTVNYAAHYTTASQDFVVKASGPDGVPEIYAELAENGITVSLANIEVAKQTRAWALMRKEYAEHTDDMLIDMLMSGLTIPDQNLMQPVLLQEVKTIFGMSRRFATDAENLDKMAVNGATVVTVRLTMPRVSTGGILLVTAEALPEQLWERVQDPFLHLGAVADLPDHMPDFLDPQKVEIVRNGYIDTDHDDPTGLFGYAPLNHKYMINAVRIGGKFMRPEVDGITDDVRQRLWAVEQPNPNLGQTAYLATNIHQKPFKDTIADPFEAVILGGAVINGNTVFGMGLIESGPEYDTVLEDVPNDRIVKEE